MAAPFKFKTQQETAIGSFDRVAPATGRPRVNGKFLEVNGQRLLVKGVAYGTFAPDETGVQFPAAAQVADDFARMARAGINVVRLYTVPPAWLLDCAAHHGLRAMIGLPWGQHVAFLDDRRLARRTRRDAAAQVRALGSHPAALLFCLGNEIPSSVVRWHGRARVERFLRNLYDDVKEASPDSLLTYVNFPPTEYLDADCYDVCAFNVYLHREPELRSYLARLQQIAGVRPLLLAEAGADSVVKAWTARRRSLRCTCEPRSKRDCAAQSPSRGPTTGGAAGRPSTTGRLGWSIASDGRNRRSLAVARAFADAPFSEGARRQWPSVSVVVCAYNAADTIDDCLSSLQTLTYPDFEVIVVNDGSRDATSAIAHRDPGVRVIDIPNGGLSAARNIGLAEAVGEIVAYTDADVRVDANWLSYLVQPFVTSDVVGSAAPTSCRRTIRALPNASPDRQVVPRRCC